MALMCGVSRARVSKVAGLLGMSRVEWERIRHGADRNR